MAKNEEKSCSTCLILILDTQKPTKELTSILQQFSEIKDDVADIKIKVNSVEDQNSRQISNLVEKKIEHLGNTMVSIYLPKTG